MIQKFGCLVRKGLAEVRERELPSLDEHDVLLKPLVCNICTSDYTQWMGQREHQGYPMAGGHELSAEVVATGSAVTTVNPGDFVAPMPPSGCGACEACRVGKMMECSNRQDTHPTEDGYVSGWFGFANYSVRKDYQLYKMNPELSPADAAFMEPLSTVVHGMKKLRIRPYETIAVIGGGTMGLLNALAAKTYNCRVIVSEGMPEKLAAAREMGLETVDFIKCDPVAAVKEMTGGAGADAVIICAGNKAANAQALRMVRELDGRVLYFAAAHPAPAIEIDSNELHYRKLELLGTFGGDMSDWEDAAMLLNTGRIVVSGLVEKQTFGLGHIQEAFAAASVPGKFRVSVLCQED
ncbi:zinc-dependent alcohol dehydrogenase [Diplocloster hominis]|uniref:zinc-dependent alcohol dehydrogenase n=1 Tax=Diplocloster hominis TaxID=3079010 RepID=UPI0031B9C7AB